DAGVDTLGERDGGRVRLGGTQARLGETDDFDLVHDALRCLRRGLFAAFVGPHRKGRANAETGRARSIRRTLPRDLCSQSRAPLLTKQSEAERLCPQSRGCRGGRATRRAAKAPATAEERAPAGRGGAPAGRDRRAAGKERRARWGGTHTRWGR